MSSRSKKDTHKKGERVQARWAGSNIFFDAKVVDVTSRTYKVQFDDGSISSLKYSDVKKLDKSDTPPKTSKSKSRSRSRSTGRQTRSRSRSPARREKAAAAKKEKKSPAKEVVRKSERKSEGTSNSNSVPKDEVDSISKSLVREKISSSKTTTVENAKTPQATLNSFSKDLNIVLRRHEGSSESSRVTRLTASKSENSQRILESKFAARRNAKEADKGKYSDDEEEEEEEEDVIAPKPTSKLWKTAYFFGTVLKAFVPASLLFLVYACTKKQCTVLEVPHYYSRLRDFGNAIMFPMLAVFVFHLLQGILSLIPIGKKVTGFSTEANKRAFEYRLNGILSLGVIITAFAGCAYFGVNMNWAFEKFRGISLSCALYCILCSLILHSYSLFKGDSNTQAKAPIIGTFYHGAYVNPVIFKKLDVKTSFIRTGLIGAVFLNLCILLKYFLMKGFVTVPLALTSGMQIFFVLDFFVREEKMLSTATYTTDTLGYSFIMTTGFMIPISLALQNLFLFYYDTRSHVIPHWCSAAMLVLFFLGYYIYLSSSNMKHNFRRNPFSPEFADVTSIPTSKKKRLIASGWWGRVRHPNYLGLFIMATAWTLPCGFTHVVPHGPLILLTIALIVRIFRVEAECKEKYGPAWNNYTEKVRSRILPFIF